MEQARLTSARATLIKNALISDGTFAGTDSWLEDHHIARDEYETFLDYGERLARMYEWREQNMGMPPVTQCDAVVTKGNVTAKGCTLTVEVQPTALPSFLALIDEPCVIQAYPAQMPLPLDDEAYVVVDREGEIVG